MILIRFFLKVDCLIFKYGKTGLLWAAKNGNLAGVEYLLDKKSDIDHLDYVIFINDLSCFKQNRSPLKLAYDNNNF